MATIRDDEKVKVKKRSAVDVSREIIIDALFLTTDLMHSIRNNLPMELSAAQLIEHRPRDEDAGEAWTSGARGLFLAVVSLAVLVFLVAPFALNTAFSATNGKVIAEARLAIGGALPTDVATDPGRQLEIASQMIADGDLGAGTRIMGSHWKRGFHTPMLAVEYAEALIELERYREARAVAVGGLRLSPGHEALEATFVKSITLDPTFAPGPQRFMTTGAEGMALFETKPVTFRVLRNGGEAAQIFRPAQRGSDDWRREIVAYRLCEAILCAHRVPETRSVRIRRDTFEALYDAVSSPRQIEMKEQLENLDWETEDGIEYIRGALSNTVSDSSPWPVEHTRLWRNWLSADVDASVLNEPFLKSHAEVQKLEGDYYSRLEQQTGDATTHDVARQLSSMMAFDFLTNHWSRFERDETRYGAKVRFTDGMLVSDDHSGAFRERSSKRVRGRFRWMTRLNADTAAAIRALDREALSPILFGEDGGISRRAQRVFWRQVDRFERRIERLHDRYGVENVAL